MAAERSAARIERMGYDVGYRLCERLAQHRPLLGPGSPSPESGSTDSVGVGDSGAVAGNSPIVIGEVDIIPSWIRKVSQALLL